MGESGGKPQSPGVVPHWGTNGETSRRTKVSMGTVWFSWGWGLQLRVVAGGWPFAPGGCCGFRLQQRLESCSRRLQGFGICSWGLLGVRLHSRGLTASTRGQSFYCVPSCFIYTVVLSDDVVLGAKECSIGGVVSSPERLPFQPAWTAEPVQFPLLRHGPAQQPMPATTHPTLLSCHQLRSTALGFEQSS